MFNKNLVGAIPSSVTHLTLGTGFRHNLFENIPKSVSHLTLKRDFMTAKIESMPGSITHLNLATDEKIFEYGTDFNHFGYVDPLIRINQCIPPSIKLTFDGREIDLKLLNDIFESEFHDYNRGGLWLKIEQQILN